MADHGYSKYTNEKCRCDICRRANSERVATRRAERIELTRNGRMPEGVTHGVNAYMNWGCRCQVCRDDRAATDRVRYAKRRARRLAEQNEAAA